VSANRSLRAGLLAVLVGALALAAPAAAQASYDVAVEQTVSAHVVSPGATVKIVSTVKNVGTETATEVGVELGSLAAHGAGADTPYQSVATTQGQCTIESGQGYGYTYHFIVCKLGDLAPGAGARIEATVVIDQTAVHSTTLLGRGGEGLANDDDFQNNQVSDRITASAPPLVAGSKKIKIGGLPKGCASGDFTLKASSAAPGVKKMRVSLDLGFDENGVGHDFAKNSSGHRIVATVPVTRIAFELGKTYTLKIKAKRGGAGPLVATVSFQIC
jgi:Domain of unknown function DUF11